MGFPSFFFRSARFAVLYSQTEKTRAALEPSLSATQNMLDEQLNMGASSTHNKKRLWRHEKSVLEASLTRAVTQII